MACLLTSIKIKDVELKNKIITAPMCMYSATDGFINDWHFVHYSTRAMGGAGMVILEATAVSPKGRISIGDLGIWKNDHIEGLKKVTSFMREHNCVPAIQLAHAGRKGSYEVNGEESRLLTYPSEGGWDVFAPSAIPFSDEALMPIEMSIDDIHYTTKLFAEAANRAFNAGFQVIEIHAAHGYLLHEFLSPLSNHRTDEYGGSIENRSRFLLEVVDAIKKVWPDNLPVSVRISATEWVDGGWNIEDSIWLSKQLAKKGISIIDVSSGGNIADAKIPVKPGYQVPLANAIKKELGEDILVGTVGLITKASQAETILNNKEADLILMGRELLRNPYFPLQAIKELNGEGEYPEQYKRAFK